MQELIRKMQLARNSLDPILITGETGTGKELLSRAAHALSARQSREFHQFNCAALSPALIESQLFGHLRGSFTDASTDFKGVIRAAEGGTLLLDEIGELSLDVQPKLLRFLQEGEVQPVGAAHPIQTDVRLIAATNRNLEEEVHKKRFREDFFERLNVLRFHIPPLRERREDIPPLLEHFLDHYQQRQGKRGLRLSDEAVALLCGYDWPRNVRQLANEVCRLVALAEDGAVIGANCLSPDIRTIADPRAFSGATIIGDKIMIPLSLPYSTAKNELERLIILNALDQTGSNQSQAAAKLQMNRDGLRKAIKRLGIDAQISGASDNDFAAHGSS